VIELTRVTKCFNYGKANQFTAVDEVSLTIRRGRITVLKGPSGSGKTTLLSLIGCMSRPTSGRIRLGGVRAEFMGGGERDDGLDITALPERFLTEIRRATYGFIFQQFNLIKGISVLENVMLPTYPAGQDHAASKRRALELLDRFEIARHAASPVDWLSGGELQRVAFARALVNDPAIVIADEPTAHLDSRMSRDFMQAVGGFRDGGKTVLIASHDPIVHDSPLADTVLEIRDGRLTGSHPTA
jgi:putative ABC transport system ATP-binding protein